MHPIAVMLVKTLADVLAGFLLMYVLFYRRYKNKELFASAMLLNIFVFCVISIIAEGNIGLQAGLGLFAMLSILRFRSETFTKMEMAYFFGAIAVATVNGIADPGWIMAMANGLILVGTYVVDHERWLGSTGSLEVTLDHIPKHIFDDRKSIRELGDAFKLRVTRYTIKELDYVKETALLEIHYVKG